MNAKHTPGPWKWVGTARNPKLKAYLAHNCTDLHTSWVGVALDGFTDNEADARLIAAAPELLAALKFFADHCDPQDKRHLIPEIVASSARTAIAKATGEQP